MTDPAKPKPLHKYKHEQIQEVLAEVYFERAPLWSVPIAKEIATRIDPTLAWKESRKTASFSIQFSSEGERLLKNNELQSELFATPDGTVLQLAESLVVVNFVPPYKGFVTLHKTMLSAMDHWLQKCGDRKVVRGGLRYIDRLLIPEKQFELSKYLNLYPATSPEIDTLVGAMGSFRSEVVFAPKGPRHRITVRQGSANSDRANCASIMIDTYDIVESDALKGDIGDFSAWMVEGHDLLLPLFEAIIADPMKKILNEGLPEES
jgi:uncharacterized protein (TIGR04255 family)